MRKKISLVVVSIVGVLVIGLAACVSQPPGMGRKDFDARTVISELSLFLPENLAKGVLGGFGGSMGPGGGQPQERMQGAPVEFSRDEGLFLASDQITKLLPIIAGLKENPSPTTSKAKQVQASIDAILTDAQKTEYQTYLKSMEKEMKGSGPQRGGPPPATQGGRPGGPPPHGERGAPERNQDQRLQKELEAFMTVLQDYQKQIGS